MSPTARTLKSLRENGCIAEVVERWIPRTKIRKDLFGCIDIIAICGCKLVGINATDGTSHSKRVNKALALAAAKPEIEAWLRTGSGLEVWSWALRGGHDERKSYKARVTQLTLNGKGKVRVL
jgi:hypothetical protein